MNSTSKPRRTRRIAAGLAVAVAAALAMPLPPVAPLSFVMEAASAAEKSASAPAAADENERPVTVEVTPARTRVAIRSRTVAGRVEPARTVDLAFQVSGQIMRLAVEPGDRIRAGDLIAELDRVDFELAVARAQAAFDLARSQRDRAASLAERGVAADSRLDEARAQYEQAEVALREAERRLFQTRIVAPFDAIVARTFVEDYVNVTSAAAVVRLQDVSEMRVVISLPEELAGVARAAPGAIDMAASFPAVPGFTAPLALRTFSTDADPTARTYDVELGVTGEVDPRLLPGMTAEVSLAQRGEGARPETVVVPVSAVDTASRTDPSVWIYDEASGAVTRKTVRLGLPVDDEIEILDGLTGDELVVSGGWWRLREDQTVAVSRL
jgi:RND family efflux transporter MFP subunit